jgi:PHD and RING finger domain-containing protein 1
VEEEVKLALKPFYNKGEVNKDQYKDIMRKAVPKVIIV